MSEPLNHGNSPRPASYNYFERINSIPVDQKGKGYLVLDESEKNSDQLRKPVATTQIRELEPIAQPKSLVEHSQRRSTAFESPIHQYRACPGGVILEKSVERTYIRSAEKKPAQPVLLPSRLAESQTMDQQGGSVVTKKPANPVHPISPITQPASQTGTQEGTPSIRDPGNVHQQQKTDNKLKLYNLMIPSKVIRAMEISKHGELIYLSSQKGTEVVNMYSLKTINSDPNIQGSSIKVTPTNTVAVTNTATGDLELYNHTLARVTALRNPQPLPQSK